jgi:hypothetical protein
MNTKRIFGILLSIIGIGAMLYTIVSFTFSNTSTAEGNTSPTEINMTTLLLFSIWGLIFFLSGISLMRGGKREKSNI